MLVRIAERKPAFLWEGSSSPIPSGVSVAVVSTLTCIHGHISLVLCFFAESIVLSGGVGTEQLLGFEQRR